MTKQIMDVKATERELATTCVRHLYSPGYTALSDANRVRELVLQGYYAFLEYAVITWADHLRAYISRATIAEVQHLLPDIQAFLDMHCNNLNPVEESSGSASPGDILSQSLRQDLQVLEYAPTVFAKIVHLSRLKIQPHNCNIEAASGTLGSTNLGVVIVAVRHGIEDLYAAASGNNYGLTGTTSTWDILETYYGTHCFKCSQENCGYFSEGFPTRTLRDQHETKHSILDFICTEPGCGEVMTSFTALRAHQGRYHTQPRQAPRQQPERVFPSIARSHDPQPRPLPKPVQISDSGDYGDFLTTVQLRFSVEQPETIEAFKRLISKAISSTDDSGHGDTASVNRIDQFLEEVDKLFVTAPDLAQWLRCRMQFEPKSPAILLEQ